MQVRITTVQCYFVGRTFDLLNMIHHPTTVPYMLLVLSLIIDMIIDKNVTVRFHVLFTDFIGEL